MGDVQAEWDVLPAARQGGEGRVWSPSVDVLRNVDLTLGECPVWDDRSGCLWFIDIHRPAALRLDTRSDLVSAFEMPAPIGSLALTNGPEIVVALQTGVFLYRPVDGRFELIANPEPEGLPGTRLNDGKAGPDGRFWVGSMDERPDKEPVASLYRIDTDGSCRQVVSDVIVSNGLAWSPDAETMYHADSTRCVVRSYAFSKAEGTLGEARIFAELGEAEGRPDGAAVSEDGSYWSAGFSAGCLNRLAPAGDLIEKIRLPVLAPSMICFGDGDLKTAYVTTLTRQRDGRGECGRLLRFRTPHRGLISDRFHAG
ncbi:MAG: SMP-30/gluconolactonase/LRE family protein [Methylobacterium mesophilicum]|nr:SMP-30/gluconolactonase/LRE family protein [Methylobacterium mesophilicum]